MPQAAILDVDGTLVDTNELHMAAWREVFLLLMPVFRPPADLAKFGEEMQALRVEIFMRDYLPRSRPFPAVRQLFERIKRHGMRIALASSAKKPELQHHLESLGIADLVEGATSADDAEHSKPAPDILQAALGRLPGIVASQALVIGDSPFDVEAAARAGMDCIGVLSGGFAERELRRAGAITVYKDVSDLATHYDESPLAKEVSASSAPAG